MAKRKDKSITAQPERDEQRQALIDELEQKIAPYLKFKSGKDGKISPDSDNAFLWSVQLCEALGIADIDLATSIVTQTGNTSTEAHSDPLGEANKVLAALQALAPESLLESMLAAQMFAVHNTSMKMLSRAAIPDQTAYGVDSCINRATKLQRTFLAQVEAWNKLRGKSGLQKVTVEHVHVHEGGQAVVGNVEGGRGKNAEQ